LEFTPGIAQVTGLLCAPRGIVLRVKIQNEKGLLENAHTLANHSSPRTTKLYDRRTDDISLDEVEKIAI
jgi:integrase/recombinase XerD